ncbi:MAG: DUF2752 domain-containing protein [Gemmatimonadota bacterium]|nr:MAG: DUF2752 domain-containing protein [Gemmatimonadota bacterium]
MKIRVVQKEKGDLDLGLVYGGIGVFCFVGARFLSELTALLPRCPFHRVTGLPCPTCGTTRSGILLSQFNIVGAFLVNPLFVLVSFAVGVWALSAFVLHIANRRIQVVQFDDAKPVIRILLVGTILANWVYLIFAGL